MLQLGHTSGLFPDHIGDSNCRWSHHQMKFMTIRGHFPRSICHLRRPKRQIKRGCDRPPTLPLPVSVGDCGLCSFPGCSATSGLLSREGRAVPYPFFLQRSSSHGSREPIWGLCKVPRRSVPMTSSGTGGITTLWVCRPVRPTLSQTWAQAPFS